MTGEPIDAATDELIRRIEDGEDPDTIEERMADILPDDEVGDGGSGAPSYDGRLYDL